MDRSHKESMIETKRQTIKALINQKENTTLNKGVFKGKEHE